MSTMQPNSLTKPSTLPTPDLTDSDSSDEEVDQMGQPSVEDAATTPTSSNGKMPLPVVLEEDNKLLHLMEQCGAVIGIIEVETSVDANRGVVVDRIICLPPEDRIDTGKQQFRVAKLKASTSLTSSSFDQSSEDAREDIMGNNKRNVDGDDDAAVEVQDTLMESLTFAILNPCTNCRQSILRKTSAYRGVHEEPRRDGMPESMEERVVSFSSLEIHEFDMTLGDHPSAISGPPVALDWNSQKEERVVPLDEYERIRSPRRNRKQMKLSYKDRKGILEQMRGFSAEEVNQAWAEALRIRKQRQETLKRGVLLMMWDDMVESAQRKYWRMMEYIGLV